MTMLNLTWDPDSWENRVSCCREILLPFCVPEHGDLKPPTPAFSVMFLSFTFGKTSDSCPFSRKWMGLNHLSPPTNLDKMLVNSTGPNLSDFSSENHLTLRKTISLSTYLHITHSSFQPCFTSPNTSDSFTFTLGCLQIAIWLSAFAITIVFSQTSLSLSLGFVSDSRNPHFFFFWFPFLDPIPCHP